MLTDFVQPTGYIYIVDVNIFFSAFLDLQSIRDDEAAISKELIFFNALTDNPITSRKTRIEVANSEKTRQIRRIYIPRRRVI